MQTITLFLKTHLNFAHLELGGIRCLVVLCHTWCLVMSLNSFIFASIHFLLDSLSGLLKTPWNMYGSSVVTLSSATMAKVATLISNFKFSCTAFSFLACSMILIASLFYEACRFFTTLTIFMLRVVSGVNSIFLWSLAWKVFLLFA